MSWSAFYSIHSTSLNGHGGKTADWLKNPLSWSMLKRFPLTICGCQFRKCLYERPCEREHRKARMVLDFCPDGTSTCRRERGLSNSKYVSNVSLVLSLSSSVIPYVIISFVGWCRVHNFRAEHVRRAEAFALFIYNTLLQILVYRWLNTMNTA